MESGRILFNRNMMFLGNADPVSQGPKRPPFFTSPEEFFDEEYYDDQLPEKKRRLTPEQVHLLENSFTEENKLEPERKTQLARKLGLQPRQVAVWFQNRRARWKTKQLERDYDKLKSSYESLMSDYDSILKEKEKLKAEVASLTEKLRAKEEAAAHRQMSSGSTTSAVVYQDSPVEGLQSEEDDGMGSDGQNCYFSAVFVAAAAAQQHQHDGGDPLGWFWS